MTENLICVMCCIIYVFAYATRNLGVCLEGREHLGFFWRVFGGIVGGYLEGIWEYCWMVFGG